VERSVVAHLNQTYELTRFGRSLGRLVVATPTGISGPVLVGQISPQRSLSDSISQMKCYPTFLVGIALLSLDGCNLNQEIGARYDVQDGHLEYVHWNEGLGTVRDTVYGSDIASFKQLGEPEYGIDKNAVFFRGTRINDALPTSFHHVSGDFWADDLHVFFVNKEIPTADPRSLVPNSSSPWSHDNHGCYRADEVLPSCDPMTFVVINFYWAKDSKHYYAYDFMNGVGIVDCDYSSMEVLNPGSKNAPYAKDRFHAFWHGREVKGADPSTFAPINDLMAKDKFRRYSGPKEYWVDKKAREQGHFAQ
jgi:hypothetical protein